MITIEFQIDENVITQDRQTDLREVDEGVLLHTYFVLPVRFSVNDQELFELPPQDQTVMVGTLEGRLVLQETRVTWAWLALPILHLAIVGLERVQEAGQGKASVYLLPGSGMRLHFQGHGSSVVIRSEVNGQTAETAYTELEDAFEKFAVAVRSVLKQQAPELIDHPQLGAWMIS